MEDNNIKKLNIEPENLPEVPRREDGTIDLEAITIETDAKGNRIIPDDIFNAYFRELPEKVINESKSWRSTASGGKIKILGGDPENDKAIHIKGAEALHATKLQRRTFAEVIEEMLVKNASKEMIEDLNLSADATNLDAIIASAFKQSARGNVKAMDFLRDTIGQKPSENINANVNQITPEQLELMEEFKKHNI